MFLLWRACIYYHFHPNVQRDKLGGDKSKYPAAGNCGYTHLRASRRLGPSPWVRRPWFASFLFLMLSTWRLVVESGPTDKYS